MPQDSQQEEATVALECVECATIDEVGRDWKAFVTQEQTLLVYCDICAEREFGD